MEDRNADVRKNAQEATLGIMIHLGYDAMLKQTEKLKPVSKNVITATLEKVRPNLPVKALPTRITAEKEDKAIKGGSKASVNQKAGTRPKVHYCDYSLLGTVLFDHVFCCCCCRA